MSSLEGTVGGLQRRQLQMDSETYLDKACPIVEHDGDVRSHFVPSQQTIDTCLPRPSWLVLSLEAVCWRYEPGFPRNTRFISFIHL